MKVLAQLTIFPTDKGESVSRYVAAVIDIIKKSGIPYQVHPLGTTLEGELHGISLLIERCFEELQKECNRVYAQVTYDFRAGRESGATQKLASLQKRGVQLDSRAPY